MRTFAILALAPAGVLAQADASRTRPDTARALETVTVSAIRARDDAPIATHVFTSAEIDRRSIGQDMPLLLRSAPSITAYSEAGNHWGYSYLRMRGIDQSRINLTIDGIPLNDPEDQVLYFADFPDLANSIESIQVQRGVGASAPGTASYGGSVNFQTIPVAVAPRGGDVQLQAGSFGSARLSAEYATGLLANRVAVYGRMSALQSSGYRRHSGSEGRSAFFGAAYAGERDVLKLTVLAGLFVDTLAYLGATASELALDRRHNPLRADEVDRFGEQIAALAYTRDLGHGASLASTVYRTAASGNYDVCISRCDEPRADLWNFHLDFTWYGNTTMLTVERGAFRGSIGTHASTYARDHHAYARPEVAQPLYFNTGHKRDASGFLKASYDVGALTLFGDVQGRHAEFRYTPDINAGVSPSRIDWTFFNPKAGATYRVAPELQMYASYGVNSREPARADMFGGFDNIDTSNADFVGTLDRVRPERVGDLEAGARYARGAWSLDVNAFAMEFRSEILPVGELTYIGTPLRTNVGASRRRGMEMDLRAHPGSRIEIGLSATAMRGRIARFTDAATSAVYVNVEPLLTPRLTSVQRVGIALTRSVSLEVEGRYVGRSQLTNTGDPSLTLPPHHVTDVVARWVLRPGTLSLHINNALNSASFAGGHAAFGEARYYVLPPLNAFLIAKIRL